MTRDDLAHVIREAIFPDHDGGWNFHKAADTLIASGVVAVDPAPDHRYEAALKVLDIRTIPTSLATANSIIARAIVAALDADARGPRDR